MVAAEGVPPNLVAGLAILMAIPVVAMALWADYYGRHLDEVHRSPRLNRLLEVRRIRVSSTLFMIAELVIYLVGYPVRAANRLAFLAALLVAIVAIAQIQFGLERRMRDLAGSSLEYLYSSLLSLASLAVSVGIYLLAVFGAQAWALWVARAFDLGTNATGFCAALGALVGVGLGVTLVFALSPLLVRLAFRGAPVSDPEKVQRANACLVRAGISHARVWILPLDRLGYHNALVTGLLSARGFLRPAMFLSQSLFDALDPKEFDAVLLHEASHLRLGHLMRRGARALVIAALIFVTGIAFFVVTQSEVARIVFPICAIILPILGIRRQVREHELEADEYAVAELGASLEGLAGALRKIDGLNDQLSGEKNPQSYLCPTAGHPATEARIAILRSRLERRMAAAASSAPAAAPVAPSDEDSTKKAA